MGRGDPLTVDNGAFGCSRKTRVNPDRNGPASRCGSSMTPRPPGWLSTNCRYDRASRTPVNVAIWPMSIEYTCRTPLLTNDSLSDTGRSESRRRAVMVTVPRGGEEIGGTCEPGKGRT